MSRYGLSGQNTSQMRQRNPRSNYRTSIHIAEQIFGSETISRPIMRVFYFEITPQHTAPSTVAIFAESADRASIISGRLMLTIERYEPRYNGARLALFQQQGRPEQLVDALICATVEGVAGYTVDDGWTVLPVPISEGITSGG